MRGLPQAEISKEKRPHTRKLANNAPGLSNCLPPYFFNMLKYQHQANLQGNYSPQQSVKAYGYNLFWWHKRRIANSFLLDKTILDY